MVSPKFELIARRVLNAAPSEHESDDDLLAFIKKVRTFQVDAEYYALTLVAEDDMVWFCCQTEFVRYVTMTPPREIRRPRMVHPQRMADLWEQTGQRWIAVHDEDTLAFFFAVGGNALVHVRFADEAIPDLLEPDAVVPDGERGFRVPIDGDPALRRAPSAKQRMRILKRDDYRCRICGRRASDNTDVELAVHHIRPWAVGGVTDDINLLTLCRTCHIGLAPHHDRQLYGLLDRVDPTARHEAGVSAYRQLFTGGDDSFM